MFICSFRQGSLNDAAEKYYRQAANLRPNVSTQAMLHMGRVPCKHTLSDWCDSTARHKLYRDQLYKLCWRFCGLFSKHQSQTLKRHGMSGNCTVKFAKHTVVWFLWNMWMRLMFGVQLPERKLPCSADRSAKWKKGNVENLKYFGRLIWGSSWWGSRWSQL